ncbi:MAG: hypothetical protein ACREVR_17990 [Burkholderiales bacterium]
MPTLKDFPVRPRAFVRSLRELTAHLRRLSSISRYLVVLAMPGGVLVLPALAWWLDRRRNRRPSAPRLAARHAAAIGAACIPPVAGSP